MLSSDAAFELLSLPALDESALQLCAPSTNKTKCNELHTSRVLPDSKEEVLLLSTLVTESRHSTSDDDDDEKHQSAKDKFEMRAHKPTNPILNPRLLL
jgi:hypothetical protein